MRKVVVVDTKACCVSRWVSQLAERWGHLTVQYCRLACWLAGWLVVVGFGRVLCSPLLKLIGLAGPDCLARQTHTFFWFGWRVANHPIFFFPSLLVLLVCFLRACCGNPAAKPQTCWARLAGRLPAALV